MIKRSYIKSFLQKTLFTVFFAFSFNYELLAQSICSQKSIGWMSGPKKIKYNGYAKASKTQSELIKKNGDLKFHSFLMNRPTIHYSPYQSEDNKHVARDSSISNKYSPALPETAWWMGQPVGVSFATDIGYSLKDSLRVGSMISMWASSSCYVPWYPVHESRASEVANAAENSTRNRPDLLKMKRALKNKWIQYFLKNHDGQFLQFAQGEGAQAVYCALREMPSEYRMRISVVTYGTTEHVEKDICKEIINIGHNKKILFDFSCLGTDGDFPSRPLVSPIKSDINHTLIGDGAACTIHDSIKEILNKLRSELKSASVSKK